MKQYLILHKVRGEPAFDIGHKLSDDMWIVSTSGHTAYPVKYWDLEDIADVSDINTFGFHSRPIAELGVPISASWPDHFQQISKPTAPRRTVVDILSLITMKTTVKARRI